MIVIIGLILLGLLLLLVEILLLPGITLAGIAAFIAFGGGIYIAFTDYGETAGWITTFSAIILSITAIIIAIRSNLWSKLALKQKIKASVDNPLKKIDLKVGDIAKTVTRLAPMGKIIIDGKIFEAKTLNSLVDQGEDVVVVDIDGIQVTVERKNKTN